MGGPGEIADVSDITEHWAGVRPDGVAVRFGGREWTWSGWAARIRRAASALLAEGLTAGDRVAFLDKNHPACLEITLACALAGTANAVVNFRLAPDEITYVVNDAKAKVLFVGAEFLPVVEKIRAGLPTVRRVVVVGGGDDRSDEYEAWLADHEPLAEPAPYQPDDCFLQLYTSGTTGFPKGVMLTHRSMTAHSVANGDASGIDENGVVLVAMPLFHVGGSSWALSALYRGARIVVVREINPPALLDELVAERVTHSFFVPAVFGFLLQVPDVARRDYSALRALLYGASPMPLPLLRRSLEVFPVNFHQVYGMTEASGAVTELGPDEHRDRANEHRLLSAGKPIGDVRIAVLDPVTGQPLGPDEVGEVCVRSAQQMAGYWERPEASAAALTPDGWLRSGDAGYLDEDGYLYISDRVKDMIISGGENIYPAEIERVLAEHPAVADVAVIGVPDEKWGEVPKAIVVPAKEQPGTEGHLDGDALIAFCREHLAAYKCPKSVDVVGALPRNPTGKILKRELRKPFWAGRDRTI